ncbi:hypothetical protein [Pseudosulfitobacter pseudonitzschiae]|uniref:hypothetical protein n=1 Tax=Pseudosulfitobacter pseudonitzschiae TaxID=1402135 RepID=UPI003B7D4522
MSDTSHIPHKDLDILSEGVSKSKAVKTRKADEQFSLMDIAMSASHIAFFPLAWLALLGMDKEYLGADYSVITYPLLIIAAALVWISGKSELGFFSSKTIAIMFLATAIMVPAMLAFTAFAVITIAATQGAALAVIWKGILFFGFLYAFLKQ